MEVQLLPEPRVCGGTKQTRQSQELVPQGVQVQVLPGPPSILRDGRPSLGRFHKPSTACLTQGPATNLRPVLPTAGCLAHIEAMGVQLPHRARGRGATGRRTTPRSWSLRVRIPPTAPAFAHRCFGGRLELRLGRPAFAHPCSGDLLEPRLGGRSTYLSETWGGSAPPVSGTGTGPVRVRGLRPKSLSY